MFLLKWFLPPSRFHRENAGHVGTSEGGKLHLSGQTSITWRQRCKDQQKFKICFSIFSGGGIGDPIRGLHFSLKRLICNIWSDQKMQGFGCTLPRIRCTDSDGADRTSFKDCFSPTSKSRSKYFPSIMSYQSLNIFPPIFKIGFDFVWSCVTWGDSSTELHVFPKEV